MTSKKRFGNTRKKGSTYKYGVDSKNPITFKTKTLPGIDTELDAKKSPARAGLKHFTTSERHH